MRPSAERPLAASEKKFLMILLILSKNKNNKNRIHSTYIQIFEVSHKV